MQEILNLVQGLKSLGVKSINIELSFQDENTEVSETPIEETKEPKLEIPQEMLMGEF